MGFALSLGETCFSKGGVITLLTSCVAGPLLSTYCRITRRVLPGDGASLRSSSLAVFTDYTERATVKVCVFCFVA